MLGGTQWRYAIPRLLNVLSLAHSILVFTGAGVDERN